MTNDQGLTRVRDKNKVKVLKERPAHLQPNWQRVINPLERDFEMCPTNHSQCNDNITGDLGNGGEERAVEDQIVTNHDEPTTELDNESNAFEVDEETENRLQELLEAANKRITRSSGCELEWNRTMDPDIVLVQK